VIKKQNSQSMFTQEYTGVQKTLLHFVGYCSLIPWQSEDTANTESGND